MNMYNRGKYYVKQYDNMQYNIIRRTGNRNEKIDFENGTITDNILSASIPMLVAQLLNLCIT